MTVNAVFEAVSPRTKGRRGLGVFVGTVALDGTNPTDVVTPFKTILAASLTIVSATMDDSGDGLQHLQYTASGNVLSIVGFEPTSGSDPTLVASNATSTVAYVVWGVY